MRRAADFLQILPAGQEVDEVCELLRQWRGVREVSALDAQRAYLRKVAASLDITVAAGTD